MQVPDVHYARSGDVAIAYQVVGEGPVDLVYVPIFWNVEFMWTQPLYVRMIERLASFSRFIVLDKRGTGLSDGFRDLPTLETRVDDLRAVLDAIGSEQAVLFGAYEGGQLTVTFAATYPERTAALVLYNAFARAVATPDYPWGAPAEEWHRQVRSVAERWGTREFSDEYLDALGSPIADDEESRRWHASFMRASMSPGAAAVFHRMIMDTDIRHVLPAIRVPTLVLYREDNREHGRFLTERIPTARAVEFAGRGVLLGAPPELFDEIERFLGDLGRARPPDRVLATILFTDIVGSTRKAAELGDTQWRELLGRHHALIRGLLAGYRGIELDTAGDGFFASFDGPGRAIGCARAICDEVRTLGLEIRAGLHTAEFERVEHKLGGIAVSVGARVVREAAPGEVLVTSGVKDLVAGSGLAFEDRGEHELRGVPGSWRLYAVVPPPE